jgi:hypothetical protein
MVLGRDLIAAPAVVTVRFEYSPVMALTNGLIITQHEESRLDGTERTLQGLIASLTPERKEIHSLVYGAFCNAIPYAGEMPFPDFLKHFATLDATTLRDNTISWLHNYDGFPGIEAVLQTEDTLINFMAQIAALKGKEHEEEYFRLSYPYLVDPERMKATMLEHMTYLWDSFLEKEWSRHETPLRQSVEAYRQIDYGTFKSAYDAVEAITGRDMRYAEAMTEVLKTYRRFIFVPSPYLGPYLSWHDEPWNESKEAVIFFGPRQSDGVKKSPFASKRAELLVWMNALADDTRLQMVEMMLEEGEICAQDFIDRLQLSQSSASRHLRQLVTAGLITSRRQDVAKCYTLNQNRMGEFVQALQHFTAKKSS